MHGEVMLAWPREQRYRHCVPKDVPRLLPAGTVVIVRPDALSQPGDTSNAVLHLRGRVVNAPVGIWIAEPSAGAVLAISERRMQPDFLAVGTQIDWAGIRAQLQNRDRLPESLVNWVAVQFGMTVELRSTIETFALAATCHSTLAAVALHTHIPIWTWQRRFRRAGLGTPARWLKLLKALNMALSMQSADDVSIEQLAAEYRVFDPTWLRRWLCQTLQSNTAEIRAQIGWHWLAYRAVHSGRLRLTSQAVEKESVETGENPRPLWRAESKRR